MPKNLMMFTILFLSSCAIGHAPTKFPVAEICPPVHKLVDKEKNLYTYECRCAKYDLNTGEFKSKFQEADKLKCDRGYLFTPEYFLKELQPILLENLDKQKLLEGKFLIDVF